MRGLVGMVEIRELSGICLSKSLQYVKYKGVHVRMCMGVTESKQHCWFILIYLTQSLL